MERVPDGKMRVMIQVRSRANDPVHKSGFHQRNNARAAQPCGSQGAGYAHAYRNVRFEHLFSKQAASFRQSAGIIGLEIIFHQICDTAIRRNRVRFNRATA